MSIDVKSETMLGEVRVYATSGRGLSPEELAEMALPKLLHVAETTCPELRAQAEEFKGRVRALLIAYMRQAIRSDRTTLHNQFTRAGFPQAAAIIAQL